MIVNSNLKPLFAICLTLIVTAIVVRIVRETRKMDSEPKVVTNTVTTTEPNLSTSQSFYSDENKEAEVGPLQKTISAETKVEEIRPLQTISAEAYLAGNVETGKIYLERNTNTVLPVASMSKLVTAIVATDNLGNNKEINVTASELGELKDTSDLAAGEKLTVGELLYPLLLNSSNVAAEALASSTDRIKFLELMSGYAWEIGMPATFFADPSGLSSKNISTARDFFALARYLYKSRQDILSLSRTTSFSLATTSDHNAHHFSSIHPFINNQNFLGGKTGHTDEAKDTMLTILRVNSQPIAIIVLRSQNRLKDTQLIVQNLQKKL